MKTYSKLLAILTFISLTLNSAADDHGDSLGTATNWGTTDISGNLETNTDTDWFKITVTQAGLHWFYTTGNTDTYAHLYDSSGNSLHFGGNSDDDGASRNFRFSLKLQPGTYYLALTNGTQGQTTGSYQLHWRKFNAATSIDRPNIEASLGALGDLDLYQVTLTRDERIWLFTTGNTDTYATLYDNAGNSIHFGGNSDDDGADRNFRFTEKLLSGTYYLLIEHGGAGNLTGNYTLSFRNPSQPIHLSGANRESSLRVHGDLDLYRVDVSTSGPVWIFTQGNTDTYATLYDDAGNSIHFGGNSDDDGAGRNFLFSENLAPGAYYLLVEHGGQGNLTGPYTLSIRDASRAIALTSDGVTNHEIGSIGDMDLYRFNTEGGSCEFFSTGTTDTYATLYNNTGSFVDGGGNDQNDGFGYNFHFDPTLVAGEYYLLVRGANRDTVSGPYGLDVTIKSSDLTQLSSPSSVVSTATSGSVAITSNTSWTVSGLPSWITASRSSGSGSATVSFNYSPNLSGASREATINIGGQNHQVVQRAQGDTTGATVPGQISLNLGVIISIPTQVGVSYRVETSTDMNTWVDTGVNLQGDGTTRIVAFERREAREFYRAVPQ